MTALQPRQSMPTGEVMKCRKCGEAIRPGRLFCESCGAPAEKACSRCDAPGLADARFCGMCGTPFPEVTETRAAVDEATGANVATGAADAERRQLTVLFADVVGATALSAELDPEALRDLLRAYQAICSGSVTRYGGTICQYLGDGVLAYFGFPTAHEDDAERAVLAGLSLVAGVRKLGETLTADGKAGIEARVGIHTGLAVVGEMGSGDELVNLAVGQTPNLAARIQGEAAPNSVCISAATLSLVAARFEVRELGARQLKGVATETPLFSVVTAVDAASERRWSRSDNPVVGRETELLQLLERWAVAQRGQGQVVYLSGEGGIGKSRLLSTFREQVSASAHGNAWRNIWCSPFSQNSALQPIIDLIERAIDARRPTSPDDRAQTLRQVLETAGLANNATCALIGSLLGLADPNEHILRDLAPAQRKRQTLDALVAWLQADARRHPLVVVVEDLHWVDPSTRDLLGILVERIAELPVLVVFTFRPEFVPTWSVKGQLSMIALTRLTRQQVMLVVRNVTAGKELPSRVVDELVRRADGVPLFVEEITKAIMASGLVVEHDGALQFAASNGEELELPMTLRDSLTARLDRLGNAKAVAQLASVLGREFEHALLLSVCDFSAVELEAQLAALNEANIIQQSGVPPNSHYVFKHALIQEAAYDGLLKSVRKQYHQRVAQAYVERFREVVQLRPELPAYHFSRASMPAAAVPFWQKAGELAVVREGHEEAIAHLGAALEQIALLPDTPSRAAMELGLRVAVGPALMARMGFGAAETGANYARASELAEEHGETAERFMAIWGDWLYKNTKGQMVAASRRSEDLVTISKGLSDDGYLLQARHSRWTNFFFLGDAAVARADTLHGVRLYDQIRHRHHKHLYGGHDPGVCARCFGSMSAWVTGHSKEAIALSEASISIARELDHSVSQATAHLWAPALLRGLHEESAARAAAEQLIALCERHGFVQWVGAGLVIAGAARAESGDTEFGLKLAEDGLKAQLARGPAGFSPMLLVMTAEAHLRADNHGHALTLLSDAAELSERAQVGWYRPEILRLQGTLLLQQGQIGAEEAIVRVERAAALARRQGAVVLEWRAVIELARLLEQLGRAEQARVRLGEVCDASTLGLDSSELDKARALLDTLN
jgi:class 3 adenylate cyclase/tetratricopeptide (TPR) repeat protein